MLCNILIQPPFDSACCSRYPNLLMSQKTKLQTTQIFCIRYCLGLKNRSHIGKNELNKINWLTVSNRVDQCLALSAHNFKNALSPKYIGDVYSLRISPNIRTRRSTDSFVVPFYKKEIATKPISYLASKIQKHLTVLNMFQGGIPSNLN